MSDASLPTGAVRPFGAGDIEMGEVDREAPVELGGREVADRTSAAPAEKCTFVRGLKIGVTTACGVSLVAGICIWIFTPSPSAIIITALVLLIIASATGLGFGVDSILNGGLKEAVKRLTAQNDEYARQNAEGRRQLKKRDDQIARADKQLEERDRLQADLERQRDGYKLMFDDNLDDLDKVHGEAQKLADRNKLLTAKQEEITRGQEENLRKREELFVKETELQQKEVEREKEEAAREMEEAQREKQHAKELTALTEKMGKLLDRLDAEALDKERIDKLEAIAFSMKEAGVSDKQLKRLVDFIKELRRDS